MQSGAGAEPSPQAGAQRAWRQPARHWGTLQERLTLLVVLLFLLFFLLAAAWVVSDARSRVRDEVNASLETATEMVSLALSGVGGLTKAELLASQPGMRHLRISVLPASAEAPALSQEHSAKPSPVPSQSPLPSPVSPLPHPIEATAPWWFGRLVAPPVERRILPVDLRDVQPDVEPGRGPRVMLTTWPQDEVRESWREVRRLLLVLLGFSGVAAATMTVVIRRALSPIKELSRAVDEVARGNFDVRVNTAQGSTELEAVSAQFNQMAESLQSERTRNAALARRALEIREAERRTLAAELHDHMGQALTAIRARAAALGAVGGAGDGERVRDEARVIAGIAEDVYTSARGMMHRLRPPVLDELGLARALEVMVDEWNGHHAEAFCRYDWADDLPELSESASINLYRIAQEALTNVAKHAPGARVELTLSRARDEAARQALRLEVVDDGPGFDPGAVRSGLGLSTIRERAEAMGGVATIESGIGEGDRISVLVPMPLNSGAGPRSRHL